MPFNPEMMFALTVMVLLGIFALAFPIVRRLGNVLEEWAAMYRESLPERESLHRIEQSMHAFGNRLTSLEQRMDLAAERQEFLETLMDQRQLSGSSFDAD